MRRVTAVLPHALAALALAAAASPAVGAPAEPAAPTGLARFSNHARYVDAQLSPKGTWLAVVSTEGGLRSMSFLRLADRTGTGRLAAGGGSMIGDFLWANDERVVAGLWQLDGSVAHPTTQGELLAISPNPASARLIFGWRAGENQVVSRIKHAEPENAWARLVSRLRREERRVLVTIRRMDEVGDRPTRLARLDVYDGLKTLTGESPLLNADYLTDDDGEARIAWALGGDAQPQYQVRDGEKGWQPLAALAGLTPTSRPRHYRAADRALEVIDGAEGGFGLYSVDLATGARSLIARTKLVPPSDELRDPATGRVLAVESEPDLPDWQLLDERHPLVQVLAGLLDAHPGQHVRLISQTDDGRLAVAKVYGDRAPGLFLLVDVAKRTAEPIVETRPWIDPKAMAEMTAFHVRASDGRLIHGYVTYPPGLPAGARPPLVVLPHGGPFGVRDRWGFDPEVQLLASEGFAVLQVNFRGSGGYGRDYQEAGYRRWGDRMIEDILDATRWLVKKGKVDGARVCTFGTSFGGYAAVQATILAPELFRCAAGFAGVYDLTRMERNDEWITSGQARGLVRATTGDDEAALKAASPAFHADRIKVPVLLMHGGADRRVPIAHARALRDALAAQGRPPEWLEEPLEGHGFYDEGARLRLYTRLVEFLKKHTAVPAPAPGAPAP